MAKSNISKFRENVRLDFEDWRSKGVCHRAEKMNERIGSKYFDVAGPQPFTGDVESEIVVVHLNPKRNTENFGKNCDFQAFDEYWSFYEKFGNVHYGPLSNRKHKSPFDHKQIRFLQHLGVISFDKNDLYNKLQIELIPYGSPDFNFNKVGKEIINPFTEDIIQLIASYDRKFVLFCGKVFVELLKPFSDTLKTHKFRLVKNDGSLTKNYFEVINIMIKHGDSTPIRACILPQYAIQGSPASQYGLKLAELYSEI